jgi:iron(III) transport system substrate-binding protein
MLRSAAVRSALMAGSDERRGRRGSSRRAAALGVLAALAVAAPGCRRPPAPALPEVTLYATVGDAAARAAADGARARGIARLRIVASLAEAEVLWFGEPTEVVEAGAAVAEGAAPDAPGADAAFTDPRRRFAPACARAHVLVVSPRRALPFEPQGLADLADPRLAGEVALPPLAGGTYPAVLAALRVAYGGASVARFLALLAKNRPIRAASDAEVRARVAAGGAAVGLVGSEEAAAGAASAAGLDVVVPDQAGRGAVLLPTAVALARAAAGREAPRAVAAFLAGADAERLLAARVPGFMPLRPDVPVPAGVRPAGNVRALALDWDALAAEKARLLPALRRWPAP